MSRSVVVTGIGAITSLGGDSGRTWERLLAGDTGAGSISRFDPDEYGLRTNAAGAVPTHAVDRRRRHGMFADLAGTALEEAMESANVTPAELDPNRAGVSVGTGFGGLVEPPSDRRDPYRAIRALPNMAAGHVSERIDARGPIHAPGTACAAGSHAIAAATRDIAAGRVDVAVAGGAEAPITPDGIGQFDAMRALATGPPRSAAKPFDVDRSGFVIGEGAGILVLEAAQHADERDVQPLAVLRGTGEAADAHHPTRPPEDAHGLRRAIELALTSADLDPGEIGFVNAHAPGTVRGDAHESTALDRCFENVPPTWSVKGGLGHTLGAAGAIEAVVTIQALMAGTLPPTRNCATIDPSIEIPIVMERQSTDGRFALSNAAGFGGANGVLVFERVAAGDPTSTETHRRDRP